MHPAGLKHVVLGDSIPLVVVMLCELKRRPDFLFVSRKPTVDDVGNPSSVNAR